MVGRCYFQPSGELQSRQRGDNHTHRRADGSDHCAEPGSHNHRASAATDNHRASAATDNHRVAHDVTNGATAVGVATQS